MTTFNQCWNIHACVAKLLQAVLFAGLVAAMPGHAADSSPDSDKSTYDQESVLKDAERFFGASTEGLGKIIEKVFILVYHLPSSEKLFQRFPAVDGSFYYVGGAGINYQQRDGVILAPIRLGVGMRAGASIGYMHYTREKTYLPF